MGASIFFTSKFLRLRAMTLAIIAQCFLVFLSPSSLGKMAFFQEIAHETACPETETESNTGSSESSNSSPDEVRLFRSRWQRLPASRVASNTDFSQCINAVTERYQLSLLRKPQFKSSNAFSPKSPRIARSLPLIV